MYNPDTSQGVMGGYSGPSGQQGQNAPSQGMNTVMAHDPSQMTAFQKGELGVRQQGMNLESQRLAQSGRMGEERLGIQRSQEKLNEEKNKGIHEQKLADMQRKMEDSTKKFELAQAELDRKTKAGEDTIQAHKDLAAAVEERHKHELAQKDLVFEESKRVHDAAIKKMEEDSKNRSESETTTEVNPEGTKRTTTTKRGSASETIIVDGPKTKSNPSGKYPIPKNKLDDWNKNHRDVVLPPTHHDALPEREEQ